MGRHSRSRCFARARPGYSRVSALLVAKGLRHRPQQFVRTSQILVRAQDASQVRCSRRLLLANTTRSRCQAFESSSCWRMRWCRLHSRGPRTIVASRRTGIFRTR